MKIGNSRLTGRSAVLNVFAASALAATCLPALAGEGGRYIACTACAPQDTVWSEGEFDQVLLAPSSEGANLHPQQLAVESLARTLMQLRNGNQRLLDDDAVANLSQGLSKALAKAGPQQEAIFFITSKSGGGLFGAKMGNSGRAFIDRNGLNVIFGEAGAEFLARYRATRMERPFDFGSRAKASKVVLSAEGARMLRPDWIAMSLGGNAATVGQPMMIPAIAPAGGNRTSGTAAVAHDQHYYAAQEERLKALKRLHEQSLITEQEYQAKRSEILNAW